jgi:glycosyltransferase involved in cell wall biosynthesis
VTAPAGTALRIALIAPPWYPVPPRGYGGTELIVDLLRRGLTAHGHDVTVFGAEGSAPGVVPVAPAVWSGDLGHGHASWDRHFTYVSRVDRLMRDLTFDVIHDHTRPPGLLLWTARGRQGRPGERVVSTQHEPMTEPRETTLLEVRDAVRFVAVSHAQAATMARLGPPAVVYNAVDLDGLRVAERPGDYLLTLARITPTKGQHLAIEVARRAGLPLVLAGKVDSTPQGRDYFDSEVRPHLGHGVEYLPSVTGDEKRELIAGAASGLFPLQWDEPFGLAVVECMASGVPVVCTPRGATVELVRPGVNGVLAPDVNGLCEGIGLALGLDRVACARDARARFGPERMVLEYERVYRAAGRPAPDPSAPMAASAG